MQILNERDTKMNNGRFELSYPIGSVIWDGKMILKIPDTDISKSLDLMQQYGIQEVMITGYQVEEPSDFNMDAETKRLGTELATRGMHAAQHHGLSVTCATLGTSQVETIEHIKRGVDFTASLGARALVLHTGRMAGRPNGDETYRDCFEAECTKHGRQRVLETCAENLHIAGEHAEKCGVVIAMENLDRFEPFANIVELPQLIALADSPGVGFCLDTGHAHCAGTDIVKWIDVMGDKLVTTHVHDNHGPSEEVFNSTGYVSPTGLDEHLPPGFGTTPWNEVIAGLRRSGYAHTLNFESGGWPGLSLSEGLKCAINYWRTCEYLV